jgi:hypothetical protein
MAFSGMLGCVVLTRTTQPNIPEDAILHSQLRENLKSYKDLLEIGSKALFTNINFGGTIIYHCDMKKA